MVIEQPSLGEAAVIKVIKSLNSHSHFSRLANAASLIPNAVVRFGGTAMVIEQPSLGEAAVIKVIKSLNSHSHFSRLANAASLIPNAVVRFGKSH